MEVDPPAPPATFLRKDGRDTKQMRAMSAEQGLLYRADGSARYKQGRTEVLVSVYGPVQPKTQRLESEDGAILDLLWRTTDHNQPVHFSTYGKRESEEFVKGALAKAIKLEEYPLTVLKFCIQVVQDDGSILSTAINACMIAAVDAGLALRCMTLSVTVAFRQPAQDDTTAPVLVLDPSFDEETAENNATICLVSKVEGNTVIPGLLQCRTTGTFAPSMFFTSEATARRATQYVLGFLASHLGVAME